MRIKSYLDKPFDIEDSEARVRQSSNLLTYILYGVGDTLPAGKKVGQPKIIPKGTGVRITDAKSIDAKITFVFVESAEGDGIVYGWTSSDNLRGKFSNETIGQRLPGNNEDKKGPNAVWQNGRYVQQTTLIEVVGNNNETELVPKERVEPYLELVQAAAHDGLPITLTSGFRSYPEQAVLYGRYISNPKKYALAAEPGRSNHQNGTAFDLDVGGLSGNPVYDWLTIHGPEFGFIRTVNKEPWHWEYRPMEASVLATNGNFKLSSVTV